MWRVCKSSKIKHPGGSGGLCPLDQRETQARYQFFRTFYFCQITPLWYFSPCLSLFIWLCLSVSLVSLFCLSARLAVYEPCAAMSQIIRMLTTWPFWGSTPHKKSAVNYLLFYNYYYCYFLLSGVNQEINKWESPGKKERKKEKKSAVHWLYNLTAYTFRAELSSSVPWGANFYSH